MSSPRIKNHYKRYAPYWKDYAREYLKNKSCEICGSTKQLTLAHLDQNPRNNEKKTSKYYVNHATYNLINHIMCSAL